MKRPYGSGQIYEKWGAYYGRWRTADGRRLNRRLGPKRTAGAADGLTRAQAEQAFRRVQAAEHSRRRVDVVAEIVTVDSAAEALRARLALEGARRSYLQNCESMQRTHISPALGNRRVDSVRRADALPRPERASIVSRTDLCDWRENWKFHARVFVRNTLDDLREIYPERAHCDPDWVELRESYDPADGTMLEVEALPPGYPVVHEFLPGLEGFYAGWLGRELP
jgi:hypothetical protein